MSLSHHTRLQSIDALRGLVILIMLLDHVRETFYLHMQVSDPMDVAQTDPALFFSRTLAHLCAPVFVLLTGLAAFLYGTKHDSRAAVSGFLFKRGLFLVVLDSETELAAFHEHVKTLDGMMSDETTIATANLDWLNNWLINTASASTRSMM